MASLTPEQLIVQCQVAESTAGRENESEPVKPARTTVQFLPSLTLGVLGSRWLRSYATPCHARGVSF